MMCRTIGPFNPDSAKLSVNKEAMLRSKLRIETRQWQMTRRHPQECRRSSSVKSAQSFFTSRRLANGRCDAKA
jgi:hypothetical protein